VPNIRFGGGPGGYPARMHQNQELPDEVPVADAVEQRRDPRDPPADEEAAVGPGAAPPLETPAADWQEQLEAVEFDPDEDPVEDE
jgi:hypothetical protein